MNNPLSRAAATVAAAACFTVCGLAQAQTAGTWMAKIGATNLSPNVSSGNLSAPSAPGTQIGVDSDSQVTGAIVYMLSNNLSLELPVGLGFKHKLTGSGAIAGVGQIGTVKAMPITLFGQYRLLDAKSAWRPYGMVGLTYARFYDAQGSAALDAVNPLATPGVRTGLSVESKWALGLGAGVSVNFSGNWFGDLQWSRTFLSTTSKLSTGQTVSTKLDPDAVTISAGYRF